MARLAHIIAVRNSPMPEIYEKAVPVGEMVARVTQLQKSWETVFVSRVFTASDRI